MHTAPLPETLSVTMLARRWGVSKDSVYRYLRDDLEMPRPFTLPSGLPRWRTAEIVAFEDARRAAA